jgi:putative transposase
MARSSFSSKHQLHFLQQKKFWSRYRYSSGGSLRNSRAGRKARVLSSKDPLHLVFKANKDCVKSGLRSYKRYFLILKLLQKYALKFGVKIEQTSIQYDHIHILLRAPRRSNYFSFFRVLAGQIAQEFMKQGLNQSVTDTPKKLWKQRPFSRVVKGYKAYKVVRNYIQLNEAEGMKIISYSKTRLKGLSSSEWKLLWL